uniref:GST C-terminal domain-containing protein n=1 Tax=Calcidiscus leptoporus TaxID=127549 RepID=A0A7S0J7H7_9EUKA
MDASEGPFFLGETFSLFEVAMAPFWQRYLWVGQHYRDLAFPEEPAFARMHKWWAAVQAHPAVAATLVCRARLVASYSDYALNRGTSAYAKSVQQYLSAEAQGQQPQGEHKTASTTPGTPSGPANRRGSFALALAVLAAAAAAAAALCHRR